MVETHLIPCKRLKDFCLNVVSKTELDKEDRGILVDTLIEANLRGVDTHGVIRLPVYIERIKKCPCKKPEIIRENPTTALIEGNNYLGQVCATRAMKLAVKKAKKTGIGMVGVRNSSHFGAAAYYSMLASEENMIGISLTNASPRLAPWGGREALFGNNPWSISIPTSLDFPLVLDISNSVTAAGNLRRAALNNQEIPEGWALDADGKMTTDPHRALKGILLPIGKHKGYGITMMIDILAGVLTSSGFADQVSEIDKVDRPQRVGHQFLAIDINNFIPEEEFKARLDHLIQRVKSVDRIEDIDEIFCPGEIEHLKTKKRLQEGIPLTDYLLAELNKLAVNLDVSKLK